MSSLHPGTKPQNKPDVLCVGHASFDLVFSVDRHPLPDEKIFADGMIACGGGPAANAAVTVCRLGGMSAYGGFLGQDLYGDAHLSELRNAGVDTQFVVRGSSPTPLSAVLVKPDGSRTLINYKGATSALPAHCLDVSSVVPRVLLLDGHEPALSVRLADWARELAIPVVLDAGSVHAGTMLLLDKVDYLVCSEKFARQYGDAANPLEALPGLAHRAPVAVITLGEQGLVWRRGAEHGRLAAFVVESVDTTGAGDAFHGAFALGLAQCRAWGDLLRFASAAGALCCTRLGARIGIPYLDEVENLLAVGKVVA